MIDKMTIAVDSMERMVAFYSAVLSVEFSKREMFERALYGARYGSVELLMCPKDLTGVDADVNTVQVRFVVADVDAAFTSGVNWGGKAISEPAMAEGSRQASLRDPDGNSLELSERAGT